MPIPKLKIIETNPVLQDYEQLKNKLFIDTDSVIEKPPICLSIVQHGKNYRFGTLGNFSCIGGKGKARKGFLVSAIIASCLGYSNILNFNAHLTIGKKIVLFDTEQGDYDLQIAAKRAIRLNNLNQHPDYFDVYALRQLTTSDRVYFIEQYLEKTKDVGIIFIDGIRDLLIDINNTDQSTELTTKLMQWTKVYNIHICVILHENPGSDKLRGHLGTEITNKAETVISVEKPKENQDLSIVIPKATRGTIPFKEFAFLINEYGLPELTDYELTF
ncbi:MAG: hypothetical protein JXA68_04240 [Ignavibacteriales bacterium]|nr:hypothetical protein [Ignavibacteriales bacterium]